MIKKRVNGPSGIKKAISLLMEHIITVLSGQEFLMMEDTIRVGWPVSLNNITITAP